MTISHASPPKRKRRSQKASQPPPPKVIVTPRKRRPKPLADDPEADRAVREWIIRTLRLSDTT